MTNKEFKESKEFKNGALSLLAAMRWLPGPRFAPHRTNPALIAILELLELLQLLELLILPCGSLT